ncbi:hypothetical protein M409DRAFT_22250 [Zasmidium cellare ATCC 36951]|uniref:Uncharacterized protein n=1 Tax=Zasmidium cellare ATCC 36951 TaxID=1080233 RepID=A0A6A6CNE9_ZASCE|nr:uncharacterized protein M409DRAFT_22250 [Zasmidium cellare ATCC 36951]KAF2167442.1 hypothetical protein M409DRAFT_22250 [Zasmidium cellare ATCC 36951]
MARHRTNLSPQKRADLRQQAKDASAHNATKVPLLKLSAEVRNQIFQLALPTDNEFKTGAGLETAEFSEYDHVVDLEIPGLLSTCRQTRQESSNYFYSNNSLLSYSLVETQYMPDLTTYTIHKTLKEFPRAVLRLAKAVYIILQLDFRQCQHPKTEGAWNGHDGEVHFVMDGDRFVLHSECNGCVGNDDAGGWGECSDELVEVVDNYGQAIKGLVMDKLAVKSTNEANGTKGKTLVRVARKDLKMPQMLKFYEYWLPYDGEE